MRKWEKEGERERERERERELFLFSKGMTGALAIFSYLVNIQMLFIFPTPVLIRQPWQLKTVVFLH